VSYKVIYVNL